MNSLEFIFKKYKTQIIVNLAAHAGVRYSLINPNSYIKTNIMKSVYSQAASKGFRIFGDKKITDYMTASSYVKVGG